MSNRRLDLVEAGRAVAQVDLRQDVAAAQALQDLGGTRHHNLQEWLVGDRLEAAAEICEDHRHLNRGGFVERFDDHRNLGEWLIAADGDALDGLESDFALDVAAGVRDVDGQCFHGVDALERPRLAFDLDAGRDDADPRNEERWRHRPLDPGHHRHALAAGDPR